MKISILSKGCIFKIIHNPSKKNEYDTKLQNSCAILWAFENI